MTRPYMLTASGKHFDLLDPKPEQVDRNDIFASISKLCRFTGQCNKTYTVGQHSLLVMSLVPVEFRLEALMHDAEEAYVGDDGTPKKVALGMIDNGAYERFSHTIKSCVRRAFGLPEKMSPVVKQADIFALGLEKRWYMPEDYEAWPVLGGVTLPKIPVAVQLIRFLPQFVVRMLLHYHFNKLTKGQFK